MAADNKKEINFMNIAQSLEDLKAVKTHIVRCVMNRGRIYEDKELRNAKGLCEMGRKAFPEDPDFTFFAGLFAHREGNEDTAARLIEDAILKTNGDAAFCGKTMLPALTGADEAFTVLQRYNVIHSMTAGDIDVYFTLDTLGGGTTFGQEYVNIIFNEFAKDGRRFNRAFEWCAGPGCIGFSLLAHDLCKSLCLADIHPKSVRAAEYTVARNRLEGAVSVYESDCLDDIPPSETWDLVVGNPPHFPVREADTGHYGDLTERTRINEDWQLHKRFYRDIGKYLAEDGVLMMCENALTSKPDTFTPMIEENGLKVINCFSFPSYTGFFCMRIERA